MEKNTQTTVQNKNTSILLSLDSLRASCLKALNAVVKVLIEKRGQYNENQQELHMVQAMSILDGGVLASMLQQKAEDRSKTQEILDYAQTNPGNFAESPLSMVHHPDVAEDYNLALALAALCNAIYCMIELGMSSSSPSSHEDLLSRSLSVTRGSHEIINPHSIPSSSRRQPLLDHVGHFTDETNKIDTELLSEEQMSLWTETQALMAHVHCVCKKIREMNESIASSTLYSRSSEGNLYHLATDSYFMAEADLLDVVDAIDRVVRTAPSYVNQTVILTPSQERIMDLTALGITIDRISRSRRDYADQRAYLGGRSALNSLIEQIFQAQKRRLENQRISFDDKLHSASLNFLGNKIENSEKLRMFDQDFITREELLMEDLSKLLNQISLRDRPKMLEQRYVMSEKKERDMYFNRLADRVMKRRLSNQDAEFKSPASATGSP